MALLQISNLTFSYTTAPEPLFTSLSFSFDYGWTGVVGANGSGKTTLLRLASGELSPTAGAVNGPDNRIYCDQRVETITDRLDDFLNSWDERAVELMRLLRIARRNWRLAECEREGSRHRGRLHEESTAQRPP